MTKVLGFVAAFILFDANASAQVPRNKRATDRKWRVTWPSTPAGLHMARGVTWGVTTAPAPPWRLGSSPFARKHQGVINDTLIVCYPNRRLAVAVPLEGSRPLHDKAICSEVSEFR